MQYCTLEKEGFLGTFYKRETPSEKAVILVGGSVEERAVPRRGVYAAVRGWKITRSNAASAGENDDDGSKIPKGVQPCLCGQLDETG